LEVNWCGRGEVKTLTKAESRGVALLMEGQALFLGFYLNELLTRLLARDDPCEPVFRLYSETLVSLAQTLDAGAESVLRRFEVDLLRLLGYGPPLDLCQDGTQVQPDLNYHYRVEQGVNLIGASARGGIEGKTLLALQGQMPFDDTSLRQARGLMRTILKHYLGDRPLKSRELFRALQTGDKNP
jgi:DNA repair protein RecO (recombination protein O)